MLTTRALSTRKLYFYLGMLAVLLVIGSFILQYGFKFQPCSLCIIDRMLVMALALLFLIAAIHNPKKVGQLVYGLLSFFTAIAGIAVTGRHLWLMHLPPDKVPECGPGLNYLIETMPLKEALMTVFAGSGECAKDIPYFFGLSLPLWTMIAFILLAVASWVPCFWDSRK